MRTLGYLNSMCTCNYVNHFGRKAITTVIGDIEFNFFHRWSDFIFVVSALLTIVVFVVLQKMKGSSVTLTSKDRHHAD